MDSFIQIATLIGVLATLIGLPVFIGRKLQVLDDLSGTVEKIKNNLQVVTTHLTRKHEDFSAGEIQSFSPLRLTEDGMKLVEELKFDEAVTRHKDDFFSYIDGEGPTAKYDVENAAIKSVYFLFEKPYLRPLKTFFYNNPKRNLENTAPTLGIYLRDEYLEAHPNIKE